MAFSAAAAASISAICAPVSRPVIAPAILILPDESGKD
jgi:hypothetical protein